MYPSRSKGTSNRSRGMREESPYVPEPDLRYAECRTPSVTVFYDLKTLKPES